MNNKITFPRLATLLADESGRSKRFSEDFLREFFSLISEKLTEGDSVKIKGFGTFRLSRVEPRKSVDVTTGQPMEISSHTKVTFTPAKELAEAVNAPFEAFSAIEISDDIDIDQIFSNDEMKVFQEEENITNDLETEYTRLDSDRDIIEKSVETEGYEESETNSPDLDKEEDTISEEILIDFNTIKESENKERENVEESATPYEEARMPYNDEEISSTLDFDILTSDEDGLEYTDEENNYNYVNMPSETVDDSEQTLEINTSSEESEEEEDTSGTKAQTQEASQPIHIEESVAPEAFEEEGLIVESRKKNWLKTIAVGLGAALFALFATFAVWYLFATHDNSSIFKNKTADSHQSADAAQGFVVGKSYSDSKSIDSAKEESQENNESSQDSYTETETESDVPTAPSDAVVYDTIGTARYLTTMAKSHYGNYNLWPYIYEENKAKLGHPDRIRPGTPVVIPKLSKYGVDANNPADIEHAKKLGVEIYARYGKKI